jgi:acylphosphatase
MQDAMSVKAQRHLVSGRVQGVFFRASARQQALQLGLTGYAKNLADGRVEVVAVGEAAALQALRQWLQQGPPAASVIEVQSVDIDVAANQHANFVTL